MHNNRSDSILKSHRLKITPARVALLNIFLEHNFALSQVDLKNLMDCDRVTLYRVLKCFEEKGIVHQVIDSQSDVKYALCGNSCSTHSHDDAHVHFKCTDCKQTYCLEEVEIPQVNLSYGYNIAYSFMLIRGICKGCNLAKH